MFISSDGASNFPVHDMHMARKQTKKPPLTTKTYLREWREFRDLTLEEAGPRFGITHGQLSKIERGKSPFNQRLLEMAAAYYGCTVPDLLMRGPNDAVDLFSAYANLDEDGKRRAARMVDAIKPPR